jgi:galactose oxidase
MRRVRVVRPVLLPFGVGAVAALAFVACERTPEPTSPPRVQGSESLAETIDLTYACGNKFLVNNHNSFVIEVTWRVRGADEEGVRVLPPAPAADPGFSETVVETTRDGTLELYVEGQRVRSHPNDARPCPTLPPASHSVAASSAAEAGEWSQPFALPIVAVHLHLLPNRKVLLFSHEHPQLWDRSANTFTQIAPPHWLYCAGHAFLPDGRLLVAGGHLQNNHGLPDAGLFNYSTASWTVIAPMVRGRWYPTLTTLGSGQVVAIAGRDQSATHVLIPEVWTGSLWRRLSGASRKLPYYPRAFLAPNGRVFYAGESQRTYYLNASGTGSWTYVGDRLHGDRNYGSAVMYEPGKILYAGGGHTTNTAEVIDLNQATPQWQATGPMTYARRQLNATMLPDGTVLVTGGSSGITHNDETQPVYAAELWNPATGTWTVLASNAVVRVLHSSALLLPDGRVLLAGGGEAVGATDHRDGELFSPPYLFKGARPRISSAPATTFYGQSFTVSTPDAASITKVAWVRLGSVTHAFDQNQRYVPLAFTRTSTGVAVTPAGRNSAPPGHYMLFLLNTAGVPSIAKIQRVK